MPDLFGSLVVLAEKGGVVFIGIFLSSIYLWWLIIERYWFIYINYPKHLKKILQQWQARADRGSWYAIQIRNGLLAEINILLTHNLLPIKALIGILPLFGLLGTVIGMITLFEVLNTFGTGNTRGMADGISRALLPTTAGLVTAVIGLYCSADLEGRINIERQKTRDQLTHH